MIFSPKIVFATETFSPQACVFAFSTTDRASLLAIRKWRKKVDGDHLHGVLEVHLLLLLPGGG